MRIKDHQNQEKENELCEYECYHLDNSSIKDKVECVNSTGNEVLNVRIREAIKTDRRKKTNYANISV